MSPLGSAIVHSPFTWTDRFTNSDSRKRLQSPDEMKKSAVFPSPTSTPGFSVNTTRALTIRHKKISNPQRKKRENGVMATIPQAKVMAPVIFTPEHLDLFEAVAMREPRSQPFVDSGYCTETLKNSGSGSGLEGSNAGKQQSPGLGSDQIYRHMGYNEYLAQAAVRSGEGKESSTGNEQQEVAGAGPSYSRQLGLSTASREVCFRMSAKQPLGAQGKECRPKIQLTIPKTQTRPYTVVPQQSGKEWLASRRQDTVNTISPPSKTSRQRIGAEVPARLSVVSPLSVVEMPKPRRPFSKFSFEDITSGMSDSTPLLLKSASSDSSDDTADHDDRSSNYSPHSSVSSLTSDPVGKPINQPRGSVAFSVISPAAAGVFDSMPLTPPYPKKPRGMKSTTCLSEKINRNKPLPPEPSFEPVKPLAFARATSMRSRGKAPAPLQVFRQASFNVPRSRESQLLSLRSKYTPADLDALDDAFQRSSPPYLLPSLYGCQRSPTLSQAELALEAHLGTISEDALQDPNANALMHDPLQISRGPMHMEPSRKPPSLPKSHAALDESRKKVYKKISTHVALQMRGGRDALDKRISAVPMPPAGSINKAHRILGRSYTAVPMERDRSADSNWSSNESRKATSTSPNVLPEDTDTPDADRSSFPDAAFEEVRQRLELLSPKDDASQIFLAFHEKIRAEEASGKPPPLELRAQQFTPQELPAQELSSRHTPANRTQPSIIIPRRFESPRSVESSTQPALIQSRRTPPTEITLASNEDMTPLERRGRYDEISRRSVGSIAVSEIPDIYASLPSPKSVQRQSMTPEEVERMISAEAAEQVLLRILENLDNLQDLFSTATVSRGFYRTFKRHELPLMKNALHGMSPAAWELREMSPPYPGLMNAGNFSPKLGYTPSLYLQHYMRDMYIMIALKSMILIHCESFLRAETITALAGGETVRASQIDDAFWRVWTFCRLFGCGTDREDDIDGQKDWLKGGIVAKQQRRKTSTVDMGVDVDMYSVTVNPPAGFAQGNSGGLSAEDLYDMTEIWTCLGVLVRGFQGKRKEARDYGIFDKCIFDDKSDIAAQEDAMLEEWTYHLLTLGPPAILDVTSPKSPTAATFAHVRSRGYTSWTPTGTSRSKTPPLLGASRSTTSPSISASGSTFLKEAVSRVYEEKMIQRHPTVNIVIAPDSSSLFCPTAEDSLARQRIAAHGAEIRAKRKDPAFKALLPSEERPMSNFPEVISKLEDSPAMAESSTSTATPSSLAPSSIYLHPYSSPSTTPSSTPITTASLYPRSLGVLGVEKQIIADENVPFGPQIRDPVDIAVDRLVAMGFEEKKAKKALAETDTGESVDFDRAVEVLVRERKRDVSNLMNWNYRGAVAEKTGLSSSSSSSVGEAPGQSPILGLGIGGVPRYS